MRTFFWYFIMVKICVNFSLLKFYFSFQIFFVIHRFTIELFFDAPTDFFSNFIYIFLIIHHFLSKKIYLVSSKSFLYVLTFGRSVHKGLIFFSIFIASKKIFKALFTIRDLIRYYYFVLILILFIEIGLLCWWNFCFASKSPKFIFTICIFIYTFKFFSFFFLSTFKFLFFFFYFKFTILQFFCLN